MPRQTVIAVASENDPYAATAHVLRLSRQWGARFVNAGPFGHINADSALGDWPYGQYLLASLQPAPPPALAQDRKSGVKETSVSVRVDLGGRRIIKKKTTASPTQQTMTTDTRHESISLNVLVRFMK